jgi:hypothetical protein
MAELFQVKEISRAAVPLALEKCERYRLLSEPEQAESICLDILGIEPRHQEALVALVLAITDQFRTGAGTSGVRRALGYVERLEDKYLRAYYTGIIREREARAFLSRSRSNAQAYEGFRDAMEWFERAEELRPDGNDDAILRWNACVRAITGGRLEPLTETGELPLE